MAHPPNPEHHPNHPSVYQIRIKGHLGPDFADWFDGLAITLLDSGDTLLTGPVIDQAALHGVLRKVRDAAIPLVSVLQVQPDPAEATDCQRDV